jgi:hypothetical protein
MAALAAAAAPSDTELLARAERSFAAGLRLREQPERARPLFRAAAEAYAQLRQRGFDNADLDCNEGNAWLLAEEVAPAILAYRRGLRLDPVNDGLHEGLTCARERVRYASSGSFGRPPSDDRPPWLPRLGLRAWSFALLVGGYALCWVCLTRWRMTRRPRLLYLGLGGFAAVAAAGLLLVIGASYEERALGGPVVVVARDDVLLRRGNSMAYPPRYETPLNRGVEARLLFRRGDWVQVELSGGQVGWLPAPAVLLQEEDKDGP